jgi:hypothetical protein
MVYIRQSKLKGQAMDRIMLQPSPVTDHITDDGVELTRRLYPFFVQPDGTIL